MQCYEIYVLTKNAIIKILLKFKVSEHKFCFLLLEISFNIVL
jgi:hypothetical protein